MNAWSNSVRRLWKMSVNQRGEYPVVRHVYGLEVQHAQISNGGLPRSRNDLKHEMRLSRQRLRKPIRSRNTHPSKNGSSSQRYSNVIGKSNVRRAKESLSEDSPPVLAMAYARKVAAPVGIGKSLPWISVRMRDWTASISYFCDAESTIKALWYELGIMEGIG